MRLADTPITAIYSSPSGAGGRDGGAAGGASSDIPVQIREGLTEIDFGAWQGKTLDELEDDDVWADSMRIRGSTRAPGGELMLEVQARMAKNSNDLRQLHPNETVAVFSHADVIKAALMLYLGVPLDSHLRLEISPASVSVLELAEWGPRVVSVNA